jgi:hypothetical protein
LTSNLLLFYLRSLIIPLSSFFLDMFFSRPQTSSKLILTRSRQLHPPYVHLIFINDRYISTYLDQIDARMRAVAYSPRIWREHPLHLVPPEPFSESHPDVSRTLDWIFLISMLNFSFWSDLSPSTGAYATEWKVGWGSNTRKRWTGYHALLAAIDRCKPRYPFV